MLKLVSHCHTYHSFDSSMSVESIIEEAHESGVNCIIINDHDVCSVSEEELTLFSDNGIVILKAIEFTTKEGVHVIGIDNSIRSLEKSAYFYPLIELLDNLRALGAKIVFPHPYHATGVYGNRNVDSDKFCQAIDYAHGFEVDNYRYGPTPKFLVEKIVKQNSSAIKFIGSDAHKKSEVGALINVFETIEPSDCVTNYSAIFSNQPKHLVLKKRSSFYFKFKKFQKSKFYQSLIGLIDYKQRQKIKKLFKFGQ
ncbi:PHP domain-containing protein [Pseudoalteromonas ardens]